MSKYSSKSKDEVASRDSDKAMRRTKPENHLPLSPKEIEAVYSKGKEVPRGMKAKNQEEPQRLGDDQNLRDVANYYDDVPASAWRRGGDLGGSGRPGFDHGKFDVQNKPQKPTGPKNAATGQNCQTSPFSAAHRTYQED